MIKTCRKRPADIESGKYRQWEKDRRDRYNKVIQHVAELLPDYGTPNSLKWSKVEILNRAISHIQNLSAKQLPDDLQKKIRRVKKQNFKLREILRHHWAPDVSTKEFSKWTLPDIRKCIIKETKESDKENNGLKDVFVAQVTNDHSYSLILRDELSIEVPSRDVPEVDNEVEIYDKSSSDSAILPSINIVDSCSSSLLPETNWIQAPWILRTYNKLPIPRLNTVSSAKKTSKSKKSIVGKRKTSSKNLPSSTSSSPSASASTTAEAPLKASLPSTLPENPINKNKDVETLSEKNVTTKLIEKKKSVATVVKEGNLLKKSKSSYSIAALCQISVNIGRDPPIISNEDGSVSSPGMVSLHSLGTTSPSETPPVSIEPTLESGKEEQQVIQELTPISEHVKKNLPEKTSKHSLLSNSQKDLSVYDFTEIESYKKGGEIETKQVPFKHWQQSQYSMYDESQYLNKKVFPSRIAQQSIQQPQQQQLHQQQQVQYMYAQPVQQQQQQQIVQQQIVQQQPQQQHHQHFHYNSSSSSSATISDFFGGSFGVTQQQQQQQQQHHQHQIQNRYVAMNNNLPCYNGDYIQNTSQCYNRPYAQYEHKGLNKGTSGVYNQQQHHHSQLQTQRAMPAVQEHDFSVNQLVKPPRKGLGNTPYSKRVSSQISYPKKSNSLSKDKKAQTKGNKKNSYSTESLLGSIEGLDSQQRNKDFNWTSELLQQLSPSPFSSDLEFSLFSNDVCSGVPNNIKVNSSKVSVSKPISNSHTSSSSSHFDSGNFFPLPTMTPPVIDDPYNGTYNVYSSSASRSSSNYPSHKIINRYSDFSNSSVGSSSLVNFNLSTIFPEINIDKLSGGSNSVIKQNQQQHILSSDTNHISPSTVSSLPSSVLSSQSASQHHHMSFGSVPFTGGNMVVPPSLHFN